MRGLAWIASALALTTAVVAPRPAAADSMDPALARLVTDQNCRASGPGGGTYYNPTSGFKRCGTDDAAFAKLIAQYGFAVAPTAMHSARTTGFGGFELALEASYTKIQNDADYWKLGTEGPADPVSKKDSVKNAEPASFLQHYELKIRKGFPFGLELTGSFGFMPQTSIYTIGADVRISILEGFRTGIPAIFPEISAGGAVRTITGIDAFQLTVVAVDAQLSKPLPIAGTLILTPYIGYQWMRIFGDSGLIDLTPNTDAVNFCNFAGNNTPATPDNSTPVKEQSKDGQPVCGAGGSSADFNNTAVFNPVRLSRHRILAGLQFRVQMIKFGAHFSMDVVKPEDANKGKDYEVVDANGKAVNKFKDVDKQFQLAFDIGAVF